MEGLKETSVGFQSGLNGARSTSRYKISRNTGDHTVFAVTQHSRGTVWAGAVGLWLPIYPGMVQYSEEQQSLQLQLSPILVKLVTGCPQSTGCFLEAEGFLRDNYKETLPADANRRKMVWFSVGFL